MHVEWTDIHDPDGEFEFFMEWTEVSDQYEPAEIQSMINDTGVLGMVHTVNEHFKLVRNGRMPILVVKQDGRKLVIQR